MLGRRTVSFNLRRSGVCLDTLPVVWWTLNPLCFFSYLYKTTARSATDFGNLLIYVFCTYCENFGPSSRSGHQVTSSDLTSEKAYMLVRATPTGDHLEIFSD